MEEWRAYKRRKRRMERQMVDCRLDDGEFDFVLCRRSKLFLTFRSFQLFYRNEFNADSGDSGGSSVSDDIKNRSQHAYPAAIYCGSGEDGVCVRERTKPSSCFVHISQAINAWCAGVLNRMGKHCGCLPVPITRQP